MNTIVYHGVMDVTYKGKLIIDAFPFEINESTFKEIGPNTISMFNLFGQEKKLKKECAIPFANSKMPLFFISGLDDLGCPSAQHVKKS